MKTEGIYLHVLYILKGQKFIIIGSQMLIYFVFISISSTKKYLCLYYFCLFYFKTVTLCYLMISQKFKQFRNKVYVLDNWLISWFQQIDSFFLAKVVGARCLVNQGGWWQVHTKGPPSIDLTTLTCLSKYFLESVCNNILERDALEICMNQRMEIVNLELEELKENLQFMSLVLQWK